MDCHLWGNGGLPWRLQVLLSVSCESAVVFRPCQETEEECHSLIECLLSLRDCNLEVTTPDGEVKEEDMYSVAASSSGSFVSLRHFYPHQAGPCVGVFVLDYPHFLGFTSCHSSIHTPTPPSHYLQTANEYGSGCMTPSIVLVSFGLKGAKHTRLTLSCPWPTSSTSLLMHLSSPLNFSHVSLCGNLNRGTRSSLMHVMCTDKVVDHSCVTQSCDRIPRQLGRVSTGPAGNPAHSDPVL